MKTTCCVFLLMCLISFNFTHSANILVVSPTISKSHYVMFGVLCRELVKRGHNVTTITTFPEETTMKNFNEISVKSVRTVFLNNLPVGGLGSTPPSLFTSTQMYLVYVDNTEHVFNFTDVQSLLSSETDEFDLVISESFLDEVYLAFAHKFKAPVITMSSCYMYAWTADRFGIPSDPAYIPGFHSGYSTTMAFSQRLQNSLLDVAERLFFHFLVEPKASGLVWKYFGSEYPSVRQLTKNISLYFINTPFVLYGPRPYPPQVVDVSGIHLQPARPLSQELDRWMNDSVHGVVYFSFGSMLRGATLPADKVASFLQVFGTLKQRVLWKWEDDTLDNLPSNVKVMKWLPQRDVLAHPKVKVFVSHGGLLGTTEAIVSAVPILGIPMYGDQPNNVAALVERGVAVQVDYNNISVASLTYALHTLLQDDRYSQNAKQLSRQFLDRPQSPLETAVYWTEYVIRHRGAPHLQSAAVHLTWYQYYLLDVIAVCLVFLAAMLAAVFFLVRSCLRLVFSSKSTKLKTN